jgi:hypothetical protein
MTITRISNKSIKGRVLITDNNAHKAHGHGFNIIQCVLGLFSWAKEVKAIPLLSHTPLWRVHGELHTVEPLTTDTLINGHLQ